jgi:hypothetical protein
MKIIKNFIIKLNKFYHLDADTITRKQKNKALLKIYLPLAFILPLPWIMPARPDSDYYPFLAIWIVLLIFFAQVGYLASLHLMRKEVTEE